LSERINLKSKIQNRLSPDGEKSKIWPLLWLLILILAFAWRAQNLDAFGLSNDEGAHLMWARLAVDGYPLYSQTYAVQSPLFLEAVGLASGWPGEIQAGRWAILFDFDLCGGPQLVNLSFRQLVTALMALILLVYRSSSPFPGLHGQSSDSPGCDTVALLFIFRSGSQKVAGSFRLALGPSFVTSR
jgi:hypothetical protein